MKRSEALEKSLALYGICFAFLYSTSRTRPG